MVGFWVVACTLYPGILTLDQPIMLIISLTFCVTTICYAFILSNIWPVFFFVIELAADVAAQTVLVYLTGGAESDFFTIYIIYCASGGLFYNYRVSAVISALSLIFYSGLILLTQWGWIESFVFPFREAGLFSGMGPFQNLALLAAFLGVAVYGIWIASYFTQLRERALEAKNLELIALNRVASLTRSVMTLERVIREVLRGVVEGLGYAGAFLLFRETASGRTRIYTLEGVPLEVEMRHLCGEGFDRLHLPVGDESNQVYLAMQRKKTIIRYELGEVLRGTVPTLEKKRLEEIQQRLGFRKFVAAPLVAERKVLGALIGMTQKGWIEAEAIRTFEGFTDQAALTIDNAMLIMELKKKNIELERVSRVKSEFLATMSHELRTPLTAIIGFSELLIEDVMGRCNEEQKESLREILANGENLLQMINELLDLAKIESGKMELAVGPVVMGDLVDRVKGMITSLIQKKGHFLEVRVQEEFPIIHVDEKKVQQILLNLLSNAIKFTPNGGRISLAVDYREEGPRGARVEILVADNGIGIRKKDLETIFDSFRQVDSSYTREYQGTGLGLALVKQLVDLQGGQVLVASEVGKGSRFEFWIPSKKP